jgi:hypothetical protein
MSEIPYISLTQHTAALTARLARLRTQVAAWLFADGLVRLLWLALGISATDLFLDWFFRMDWSQRLILLILMAGTLAWFAYRRLVRPVLANVSDDALALKIEAANKHLGQSVISALQLARLGDLASSGISPSLVRHTVLYGARAAEHVDFAAVLDRRRFRYSAALLALAIAAWCGVAYGIAASEPLAIWFNRNILLGDRSWPQKTYLVIERVGQDGTVVFPRGEDWSQIVSVTEESEIVPSVVYLDIRGSQGRLPLTMKKIGERQFEATFANVIEPFEFRARGGDAVTEWVRAVLVDQPAMAELKLVVTPPQYAGGMPEELPPGRGPYYVLTGSSLSLSATANKPLARADLVIEAQRQPIKLADSLSISVEVPPTELQFGQYTIELEDTLGLTSRRPATFVLRKRVDREPRVRARLIGVSGMVVPQARIPFTCRATDDFGVTTAHVAYRWKGDEVAQPSADGTLAVGQASSLPELIVDDALELEPLKIPTGAGLTLRFEAADNDNISGPKLGRSAEFSLRVVSEDELRTDLLRREKEQRQELERLIKAQDDLLTDCRALQAEGGANPSVNDQLIQYHKRQKGIGQGVGAIAERMALIVLEVQNNRLEEEGGRLQTRLTADIVEPMQVVAEEMIPQAVSALEKTRRLGGSPMARGDAFSEAIARQTETLAKMKEILEHMVKSEGFQEAVNLLYEIQKAQTEVHEQTNKARQERIKRILEGASDRP